MHLYILERHLYKITAIFSDSVVPFHHMLRYVAIIASLSKKRYGLLTSRRSWNKRTHHANNINRRKLKQAAQSFWDENKVSTVADTNKRILLPFYVPYPSGRLHMGHFETTAIAMLFLLTSDAGVKTYFNLWRGDAFGYGRNVKLSAPKPAPANYGQRKTFAYMKGQL